MSTHDTDFAVALPSDTATFSAVDMLPVGRLETRHCLILADDVTVDEVEALAASQDERAGWVGVSTLQLMPGAELQGPWSLDASLRRLLGLPEWATNLMILECEPQRSGPLPPELAGTDPIADAFPLAQPEGVELVALTRLRAIARRLAGALLLAGDRVPGDTGRRADAGTTRTVVVQPDPGSAVDLDVYAPVWLDHEASVRLLAQVAPAIEARLEAARADGPVGLAALDHEELEKATALIGADVMDAAWRADQERRAQEIAEREAALAAGQDVSTVLEGYALSVPVGQGEPGWGSVWVHATGAEILPLAVRGAPWESGVIYSVTWRPQDPADAFVTPTTPSKAAEREAATALVEALATALVTATGGYAVDRDGFLVALA